MKQKKNIVLIGFMGCGKSTIGVRLSYRLRRCLTDTDKLIERQENRSISDIFAQDGEEYFRQLETQVLEKLAQNAHHQIISLGGGTPVREENRPLMKKIGTVVYLRIKPETVYERLKNDTTRPLLQGENPLQKIKELLGQRNSIYEACADVIVDVDDLDIGSVLNRVLDALHLSEKEKTTQEKERKEKKSMKLLVINGPNLNFLGIREKSVYGTQDYAYLVNLIQEKAKQTESEIDVFQSNHEGAIIDRIQEAYFDGTEGIVINPGAYTHYSYAIHDALVSVTMPKVEIHISDITKREEFRKISVTAPACDKQIYGQGLDGYLQAIDFILNKK